MNGFAQQERSGPYNQIKYAGTIKGEMRQNNLTSIWTKCSQPKQTYQL